MKKIYQIFSEKVNGKWYQEFEVPEALPLPPHFVDIAPTEGLTNPKYDWEIGRWIEDQETSIEQMKQKIIELEAKNEENANAILDAVDFLLSQSGLTL